MASNLVNTALRCVAVVTILTDASLILRAQNAVEKVLVGETEVTTIQSYKSDASTPKPVQVVVFDFKVPKEVITLDHSPAAHVLSHDPIARMKHDQGRDESPASVAANVQAEFSKTLITELGKTSIPVASAVGSDAPVNALTIRGDFTDVNLGNKTKRMMIGFGRGASDVKAHVVVSLIADKGPIVLAEFELKSQSGKKPGAAATSVAASGAMDGKATVEGDTARMAKAVARQIEATMTRLQWIPPAAEEK
jgi:Domain of unknown function (DUF4410)